MAGFILRPRASFFPPRAAFNRAVRLFKTAGGPALPAGPLGASFGTAGPLVEVFLDLSCPFSVKCFQTLHRDVFPNLGPGKAQFVIYQVPQPFHSQSAIMHECALAVKRLAPALYLDYFRAVCDDFSEDSTEKVNGEKRMQTAGRLSALAEKSVNVPAAEVERLVEHEPQDGTPDCQVTQEMKWICKLHRSRGVHVTPTVFVNGIEAPQISSKWPAEQWLALFEELKAQDPHSARGTASPGPVRPLCRSEEVL